MLAASDGSIGAARDAGQQAQTPVVPSEGLTSGSVTAPSASIIDALGLTCARCDSNAAAHAWRFQWLQQA